MKMEKLFYLVGEETYESLHTALNAAMHYAHTHDRVCGIKRKLGHYGYLVVMTLDDSGWLSVKFNQYDVKPPITEHEFDIVMAWKRGYNFARAIAKHGKYEGEDEGE